MPGGRPSDYTPEIAAQVCGLLVEGKSLRSICKADEMPAIATVFKWLAAHPEFVEQYARAREAQADTLADELIDIADDSANDYYDKPVGEGETQRVVDAEHINRSRLRVDTRKWVASKLKPKKYGDKIDHTLGGPNGGPIIIQSTPTDEAL
jgi:hypothetical protein